MSDVVKIVAVLTAKPGQEEALKRLLEGLVGPSRAEAGTLRYDLWQDPVTSGRFLIDELYRDAAAVAAHRDSDHYRAYLGAIDRFGDRVAFTVGPRDVA